MLSCCRVLKTKAASPVYHLDGGVYGWYRAFGDEGFTGGAVHYHSSITCILTIQVQLHHNWFCLQGHMTRATSGGLPMPLVSNTGHMHADAYTNAFAFRHLTNQICVTL